jgi:hypothetical protein
MPSIVPWGPSQDVFLVLDQFGERLGRAWRETDENDTDYETLIRHLLEGQCNNPVRVVAFNTDEGWSRDVSDDVADELRERCAQRGELPNFLLDFLEDGADGTFRSVPARQIEKPYTGRLRRLRRKTRTLATTSM